MSEEKTETREPKDFGGFHEMPGDALFNKALNEFNKKAAGAAWNIFKRNIGTVTEPFFRAGMGERYYTNTIQGFGLTLWFATAVFACKSVYYCSGIEALCRWTESHSSFEFLQYIARHTGHFFARPAFGVVAGGLMFGLQLLFGEQNLRLQARYRREGKPYHSRSRGVQRWGFLEERFFVALTGFLFLFNIPAGMLFLAGFLMNVKLRAEQNAAIMSRYQDAMDQMLENHYLRDAALGKCPTETTFLHRPIPEDIDFNVRENIADALVGKPVSGLALKRQRKNPSGDESQPRTPTASENSQDSGSGEFEAQDGHNIAQAGRIAQKRQGQGSPQGKAPAISSSIPENEAATLKSGSPDTQKAAIFARLVSSKTLSRTVIVILTVTFTVWAIGRLKSPKTQDSQMEVRIPVDTNRAAHSTIAVSPPSPQITKQSQESPITIKPETNVAVPKVDAIAKARFAAEAEQRKKQQETEAVLSEQKAAALQERKEKEKLVEQIKANLETQIADLGNFKTNCETRLSENTDKISKLSRSYRKSLGEGNEKERGVLSFVVKDQSNVLEQFLETADRLSSDPQADLIKLNEQWQAEFIQMNLIREKVVSTLDHFDIEISDAPPKGGFLFAR